MTSLLSEQISSRGERTEGDSRGREQPVFSRAILAKFTRVGHTSVVSCDCSRVGVSHDRCNKARSESKSEGNDGAKHDSQVGLKCHIVFKAPFYRVSVKLIRCGPL